MSTKITEQIWPLRIPRGKKIVLLVLAKHADQHGKNAFPSKSRIADMANEDPRSVQRALVWLRENGWISADPQSLKGGRGNVPTYTIHPKQDGNKDPAKGDKIDTQRETKSTIKGDKSTSLSKSIKGDKIDTQRETKSTAAITTNEMSLEMGVINMDKSTDESDDGIKAEESHSQAKPKSKVGGKPKLARAVAIYPTFEELNAYFTGVLGRPDLAQDYWDDKLTYGWKHKRGPILDWQASCRTWVRNDVKWHGPVEVRKPNTRASVGKTFTQPSPESSGNHFEDEAQAMLRRMEQRKAQAGG